MTREEIKGRVGSFRWWHQIDLGNGIVTPGPDPTRASIAECELPADLTGKTVLDIGAWDGAFSFEAERRGAKRVLAIDEWIWKQKGWASKEGFDFARLALNSKVEDAIVDVYDLNPKDIGTFDLVIFSGVLYHLKHPLYALEKVASVCANQLILSTHIDMVNVKRPAIAFYAGTEYNNDPTNWCGPNLAALEAMLRTVGFDRFKVISTSPIDSQFGVEDIFPGYAIVHGWL